MAVMRTKKMAAAIAVAAALGAVAALPAHAAPPEEAVVNSGAKDAIDGSYIVTLASDSGLKSASRHGRRVISEYGGTVRRTYTDALNGYAVQISPAQARRLAADPAVDKVFQDRRVRALGTQYNPPSWGLDRIDQARLPLDAKYSYPDSAGYGTTVYVIDTGVRVGHRDFGGRATYGYDAVDGDHTAQDGNGHGTHVASTAAGSAFGVAKRAKVVAVRVLDDNGSGTTSQVIAGIDWATRNHQGPSVANLSLGGGPDPLLDTAVRNSIAAGLTYSVAAGQSGSDAGRYSPGRVPEAITVGATNSSDARADSSNYGPRVDLFAPGVGITGAWNTADDAAGVLSGTSAATAHVAGAAAVYLAGHPAATPAQVSKALSDGATVGAIPNPGPGSPNKLLRIVP